MTPRPAWLSPEDQAPDDAPTGPSSTTRALVLARADDRCESCGTPLVPGRLSLHHRRPSGMGGTRDRVSHAVTNLLALCGRDNRTGCHGLVHSNPEQARDSGLLVRKAADPARVPVLLHDRRRVLLLADGTYRPVVMRNVTGNATGDKAGDR